MFVHSGKTPAGTVSDDKTMWSALKSTIMKTLTCICALIYLAISQLDASQAQDKPFDEDSKITKPLRHVENWPQWRGPTADGHAGDHASPPIHWNKEKNIACCQSGISP